MQLVVLVCTPRRPSAAEPVASDGKPPRLIAVSSGSVVERTHSRVVIIGAEAPRYRQRLEELASNGYEGFVLR